MCAAHYGLNNKKGEKRIRVREEKENIPNLYLYPGWDGSQ